MKKTRLLVVTVLISMLCLIPASAFANSAVIDQSNDGPASTFYQINYCRPVGQEFKPSMPVLVGVEVYLQAGSSSSGTSIITVNIRRGRIGYPIIEATSSQEVANDYPSGGDWIYFEFTTPVSVTPEYTYVLEVVEETPYHMWGITGDFYPRGRSIMYGNTYSRGDFAFRTYGSAPISVDIDIKPGSVPNSINLLSKGVVPVAILTTSEFDAATINPGTVKLEGIFAVKWQMYDVPEVWDAGLQMYIGDGDQDLLLYFQTPELAMVLNNTSTEATLTGETFGGMSIEGTDSVKILKGSD